MLQFVAVLRLCTDAVEAYDICCQCVAVCCSVLQCVVVCCSVMQCVAVYCNALQCVAVLQRYAKTAVRFIVLQCIGKRGAVSCRVLQCVAVYRSISAPTTLCKHCSALQCVGHSTVTYCQTMYHTVPHCNCTWPLRC